MSARTQPLLAVALLAFASVASAATFTANRSEDLPDSNPGDGVCQAFPAFPGGGQCTLRAAIMEANALGGSHTINLESGRTYTITRQGVDDTAVLGDLDLNGSSLTIQCSPCSVQAVVNANGIDRAFDAHSGTVILSNFEITQGNTLGPNGGAIRAGAGVTELRLVSMRIHGNYAEGDGGAVHTAAAQTTVSNSELFNNRVDGQGSAILAVGSGQLNLRETALHGNEHIDGSSNPVDTVRLSGGGAALRNSTISSNGGVGLRAVDTSSAVSLRNVTIAGNLGFGVEFVNTLPHPVVIRNSIIARNVQNCSMVNSTVQGDGYNLYSDSSCNSIAGATDLVNIDPLLTPLKRRSQGQPRTSLHWPSRYSAALSSGAPDQFGDLACEDADQVGEGRPQAFNGILGCDIGAAEVPEDAIFFDSLETL